ncbi:MAG: heavy-metal-associated domain-containing protein [Gammaproteobacteria bacterium]|nr:heavy-metal-associated domain-containing protein [Gammaproteobacteria bacterium]
MKRVFVLLWLLIASTLLHAGEKPIAELGVEGMTCPVCVYTVKKSLEKLPGVSDVKVSLKLKKARVEFSDKENIPSTEEIKKVISDAGYTPGSVEIK